MDEMDNYINEIDEKRREPYRRLLNIIKQNIPTGFELIFQYGMPSFVVPFDRYPKGYHTDPSKQLPFLALGTQKGHIGLYHLGIYANKELLEWFQEQYKQNVSTKLNMGKSCIRFTNIDTIPYDLVGQLVSQMSVDNWIEIYESI